MHSLATLLLAFAAACSGASLPSSRIIAGYDAAVNQFPYQVSVQFENRQNCGGSIINRRWILTAAHCLSVSVPSTSIVTNTVDLNVGGDRYQASQFVIHPEYDFFWIRHDIGLIKVDSDIVYGAGVQPARLPTQAFTAANYPAVVSGWGWTSFPGSPTNKLQYLNTTVVSREECNAAWFQTTDDNICTINKDGQGICHSDSGGPLTADGIVIGVVSFGSSPCAIGAASAYADVFVYLDWIKGYTG